MDAEKTGALIRALRIEKGMTQRQLAGRLMVSDKAVSKWERGMGCPDASLLPALSDALGVDIASMLSGMLNSSARDGGNMKRIHFFVCPVCGNAVIATGDARVSCCGRRLEALAAAPCDEAHRLTVEPMDGEMHIAFDHEMSKAHFIRFVACVSDDRVLLVRLYPEQGGELRVPYMPRCTYYACCSRDGLFAAKGAG